MAGAAFDRECWNTLERPQSGDWNREASYADMTLRFFMEKLYRRRFGPADGTSQFYVGNDSGVYANSMFAYAATPSTITLFQGLGVIYDNTNNNPNITGGPAGLTGVMDTSPYKPVVLSADQTVTVPSNISGSDRWDLIEVTYNRALTDYDLRGFLDPTTGAINNLSVPKTLSWDILGKINGSSVISPAPSTTAIGYKQGAVGGALPAVTSGYIPLAYVFVPSGALALDASSIVDMRPILSDDGMLRGSVLVNTTSANTAIDTAAGKILAALPAGWRYTAKLVSTQEVAIYLIHPPIVAGTQVAPITAGPVYLPVSGSATWNSTATPDQPFAARAYSGLVVSSAAIGTEGSQAWFGAGAGMSWPLAVAVGQSYTRIIIALGTPSGNNQEYTATFTWPSKLGW